MVEDESNINEGQHAAEDLSVLEGRPAVELAEMERLRVLSTRLMQQDDLAAMLHEVLTASIELLATDQGNVQLYNQQEHTLKIVTSVGFSQDFLDFFNSVDINDSSACAAALESGERVVVENVGTDPAFPELARAFAPHGIIAVQSTPLFDSQGRPLGMLSTHFSQPHRPTDRELCFLDLYAQQAAWHIERKQAEEQVATSERRYRRLFESARDGILILDFDTGGIVDANPFMQTLLGYPLEELKGKELWEIGLFEHAAASQEAFRELRQEGYIRFDHLPLMAKDGQKVDVEFISNVYIEDGDRVIQCNIRDITERRRAEEELLRGEERLQKILDTAAVGVLFFDPTGILIDANEAFLDLTGYTRQEVESRELDWRKMTPPEYLDESLRQLEQLEVTGRIGPYEKEYFCRDGSRRWMLFSGMSLGDGTIVEFTIDINDRKQAEEALQDADRRKDEFLAMLSHELRNPLAPIRTTIDLLRLGQGNPSIQEEALNALDRQVGTLTRLVDDLLDVSRVTTGKIRLQRANTELNTLVQRVSDSFRSEMRERRHEFSLSFADTPVWVYADPVRLEQVVVNLLSNAAKYTPEGGRIWVGVTREGDEALLRVKDTGVGMEPDLLPHVFELFTQGAAGPDRTRGGLGIGLALVKRLIEMHGGRVMAQSEGPGQGSAFVVRLPVMSSSAPQPVPTHTDSAGPVARSLQVLLVDDHPATRRTFGRLLEVLGNHIYTAHDGPSALEAAVAFQPDLVLLDIGLPGMDGYEVAKRMRQEPTLQDSVLVAVTGYGQESDRQRSREAGFDHHLVKPLDIDALQQLLAKIVDTRFC